MKKVVVVVATALTPLKLDNLGDNRISVYLTREGDQFEQVELEVLTTVQIGTKYMYAVNVYPTQTVA